VLEKEDQQRLTKKKLLKKEDQQRWTKEEVHAGELVC